MWAEHGSEILCYSLGVYMKSANGGFKCYAAAHDEASGREESEVKKQFIVMV